MPATAVHASHLTAVQMSATLRYGTGYCQRQVMRADSLLTRLGDVSSRGMQHIMLCPQEAYLQRMVSTHLGAHTVFSNLTELTSCMEDIQEYYAQLMLGQGLDATFGK